MLCKEKPEVVEMTRTQLLGLFTNNHFSKELTKEYEALRVRTAFSVLRIRRHRSSRERGSPLKRSTVTSVKRGLLTLIV